MRKSPRRARKRFLSSGRRRHPTGSLPSRVRAGRRSGRDNRGGTSARRHLGAMARDHRPVRRDVAPTPRTRRAPSIRRSGGQQVSHVTKVTVTRVTRSVRHMLTRWPETDLDRQDGTAGGPEGRVSAVCSTPSHHSAGSSRGRRPRRHQRPRRRPLRTDCWRSRSLAASTSHHRTNGRSRRRRRPRRCR